MKKGKVDLLPLDALEDRLERALRAKEVLEEKFTDILRMLRFDEEVPDWIRTALKESHDDETQYHREVIDKLQKDYKRLEQRLKRCRSTSWTGKIGERFYEQKSAEWRKDQRIFAADWKSTRTLPSPTWTKVSP